MFSYGPATFFHCKVIGLNVINMIIKNTVPGKFMAGSKAGQPDSKEEKL